MDGQLRSFVTFDRVCHKFGIVVLLLITVNFAICSAAQNAETTTCQTESCKKVANTIRSYMNQSVDPCNDFYEHVCGNFINIATIRDGFLENTSVITIQDKLLTQLKTSIENEISENDPQTFKKLKLFYDICMNENNIEKSSEDKFLKFLKELGGWPVLDGVSWDPSKFDWLETTDEVRKRGYSIDFFMALSIGPDAKNNSIKRIKLSQPHFGLVNQEYLLDDSENKVKNAYIKYMVELAKIFGAKHDNVERDMKNVLDLEVRLAKISLSPSEKRDMKNLDFPTKISQLQENYSYVPWLDYLNNYLSPYHSLNLHDIVILSGPKYFEELKDVLAETETRVLANYMLWRVVRRSAEALSSRVLQAQRDFDAVLDGTNAKLPRWQKCVNLASNHLPIAMGALYVRRHFDKTKKESILKIIMDDRDAFQKILNLIDWMDEETRSKAREKLENMVPFVAYPDELLDDQKLDCFHESLKVDADISFLEAIRNAVVFNAQNKVKTFNEPIVISDWTQEYGRAAVVNAFYSPHANAIILPSGFLQAPFFDVENPKYMNYAAIGYVVGHEITHGFDDVGSQFDKNGRLENWWLPKTQEEYKKRVKCMIDQYSNYKVDDLHLKGEITQGENIADNGGLKIAYNAWKGKNFEESLLPGFESYTLNKMFWISAAHPWCIKYRPQSQRNSVLTDPHSPNYFRVNGVVSNIPEFAADFNCPKGSPMNPDKKCQVW